MNKLFYLLVILSSSCIQLTAPEHDCQGVLGGNARLDDCGECTGGTTGFVFNYSIGCDSMCDGKQYDCANECGGTNEEYYYCDFIGTLLDLETRELVCRDYNANHFCGANTDACKYVDCNLNENEFYLGTVIDCAGNLPLCDELECSNYNLWIGSDDGCDEILNCIEFNYDWEECPQ